MRYLHALLIAVLIGALVLFAREVRARADTVQLSGVAVEPAPAVTPVPEPVTPPRWAYGVLVPTLQLGFDQHGTATITQWTTGAGYAVSWRFLLLPNHVWLFSVGGALFVDVGSAPVNAGIALAVTPALCLGVWDDVARLCPRYDLVSFSGGQTIGLLALDPRKQDFSTVFAVDLVAVAGKILPQSR